MTPEALFLRQAVVCGSGLVYWAGVFVQIRRVRRQIGRSPNVKPRETKEKLLWLGWLLVVAVWVGQPFWVGSRAFGGALLMFPTLVHPLGLALGLLLIAAGYASTLWCYAAMGGNWRMGVNPSERTILVTRGPYRWVRHPIYLFQIVMLVGAALLLPTALSVVILLLHFVCVWSKAAAEEGYLATVHGAGYRDYLARTGRLFPRWRR